MHRRSLSGSATEGSIERALVQRSGSLHGAVASSHSSCYAVPSWFRAEPEVQYANNGASASLGARILSEDQIVCQSKLYDAFELQELEQQLDRKLNFHTERKFRSFSSWNCGDQASLNSEKSLLSVSDPRDHASFTCNFGNTDAKNASLSSLIKDSGLPICKESLTTASNVVIEPVHLQAEAGCSCNQYRIDMNNPLQEESYGSRSHYLNIGPAVLEQEAPQDLQVLRADEYAILSTANVRKQTRAKRSRWPLVNWLFRSHKKQGNIRIMQEDVASTSNSMNFSKHLQNREYHHHHNIVHYHHVHHHHHHHMVSEVHFEEIDWPLSPARLQEPTRLAHVKKLH